MKWVFADTQWWVATTAAADPWARVAEKVERELGPRHVVTTDEVLIEFAGFLSGSGPFVRGLVTEIIRRCLEWPDVSVVAQSRESLLHGLLLYEARRDKGYSLVDCVSMLTAQRLGIVEVLTADRHFEQEGFVALLRDAAGG